METVFVTVYLKTEILDPQGRAVLSALLKQDLQGLQDVRQGKQFKLTFNGPLSVEQNKLLEKIASQLLSNPVIEDFLIEMKNES